MAEPAPADRAADALPDSPHDVTGPDCDCGRRDGQPHAPWCAHVKAWWQRYHTHHGRR